MYTCNGWRSQAAPHLLLLLLLQGAATSIYLASSPDAAGLTSKYWDSCKPVTSSPASYDTGAALKLWDVSCELTGV